MKNTPDEIRKLNKNQLTSLLIEISEIGDHPNPKHFNKSPKMEQLFELEKPHCHSLYSQYFNVQTAIEREILFRVKTGTW